jgi:hypothetical protein
MPKKKSKTDAPVVEASAVEEEKKPQELSKPEPAPRGPEGKLPMSLVQPTTTDEEIPTEPIDESILNSVMGRLWKKGVYGEEVLALEVIEGPYIGVVFGFSSFEMLPLKIANGLVPVKFDTTIFKAPKEFVKDEAFDLWCSEVVVAWLHYIAVNDFQPFIKSSTAPGIH